jgi:hypothetical protein
MSKENIERKIKTKKIIYKKNNNQENEYHI